MSVEISATSSSSMEFKRTSPYPRDWLLNVLRKHENDDRLMQYQELRNSKYPILKDKALVCAPMVDASDLPFRMLCRKYNTNLCFTPMIHAKMFCTKESYRNKFWHSIHSIQPEDRPLIAQLCGSDIPSLVYTCNMVAPHVDGIDLNCGCPQSIAKRGQYGAFLLEKGDLIANIVHHLVHVAKIPCPISVKVRLLPPPTDDSTDARLESDITKSLKLYSQLVEAGAAMLTIHGRNRFQKLHWTGRADWNAIAQVVQLLGPFVPIIANGNIANLDHVIDCLKQTGADGVMSSEGLVEYPALFSETNVHATNYNRTGPSRLQLTQEYVDYCQQYPPELGGQGNGIKCVRAHIFRFCKQDLENLPHVRDQLTFATDYETIYSILSQIQNHQIQSNHSIEQEQLSWYIRHRLDLKNDDEKKEDQPTKTTTSTISKQEEQEAAECCSTFFNHSSNPDDDGDY